MSDGSDSDVDIDKLLSDLNTFDKNSNAASSRNQTNSQLLNNAEINDNTDRPEKYNSANKNASRNSIVSGKFPLPKVGQKDEDESASFINKTSKAFSQSATKIQDDKSRPTSAAKESKGDWLGLGPSISQNKMSSDILGKSNSINDDGDDDILRSLRVRQPPAPGRDGSRESQGQDQIRQNTEKPRKPLSAPIADDEESHLLQRLNAAKKMQQRSSEQRAPLGLTFQDKLPQSLNFNLNEGPSLFKDKFGFSAASPTTPPLKSIGTPPVSFPVMTATGPGIPSNEDEKKTFLQSIFGSSSNVQTPGTQPHAAATTQASEPNFVQSKKKITIRKQGNAVLEDNVNLTNTGKNNIHTLQLASHLVDEDELKTMSSSLKSLYTNQLEMMEKSYAEQMACLTQSHARKEEMLKEEIRMTHKDYESRLERVKNDLLEAESRPSPAKQQAESNSGILHITDQLKLLQNKIDSISTQYLHIPSGSSPRVQMSNTNPEPILESVMKEMDQIVAAKFTSFEASLMYTLCEKLDQRTEKSVQQSIRPEISMLSDLMEKFENKRRREIVKFGNSVVEGTANTLSSAIQKLSEVQKKVGESQGRKMLISIGQTLESQKSGNTKNKEKDSNKINEFREDLRKFSIDMENKTDTIRKSQSILELEQKQMTQNLHELNNWLQAHFTRNSIMIGSAQATLQNSSVQTELEVQLLKEERISMSETLAEINVERRKLHEEKVALEQERRELHREQNRVQDLQNCLKLKITDTEEMQKEVETARQENYNLGGEIVRQQNEIAKDRIRQKESLRSIEENLRLQQENLFLEKMDISKEKEFFEKLRNQLLCPGCLKSLVFTSPMIQIHQPTVLRTIGDGLEKPIQPIPAASAFGSGQKLKLLTEPIQIRDEHLNKDVKILDDLYFGFSNS